MAGIQDISTEELLRMRGGGASPADISQVSTEDLLKMRSEPAKKPGAMMDIVKSIPGVVPRAASGIIGLPQSIAELATTGIRKGGEALGLDPRVGEAVIMSNPMTFAADHLTKSVGNVGDTSMRGYDTVAEMVSGKPLHRPQTGPGRVTDLVLQTAVSGPGSMVQKVAMGGGAGLSGEGARLVTDNPIAIGVVQMLGGGAASLPWILRSVPAENINEAIKHIKPQDLVKAQQLMDDAAASGLRLTGAEAIAQVTGKNTLQDIQRVVESSKRGGPTIQGIMNERPAQVRGAVESGLDQVAPMPQAPSRTPVRVQAAAEQSITRARQAGNAAAEPFYDAARTQRIGSQEWNTLTQNPATQKALQAVKADPIWGVTAEKEGSIAWLDAAKKWIDGKMQSATPPAPAEARIWNTANDEIKAAADAASAAYKQARGIVAQNNRTVVDPMKASPVGDIAQTKGLSAEQAMRAQSEVLMPTAPRALDPWTIRQSVRTMNTQDPTAARDFVRQNLQAIFDENAQNLVSGANQWGGAKFAANVAGNPRQRENLQALIESVGDKQAWNGFNRLLEVLEATGKRHVPGSPTQANQALAAELSASGLGGIAAGTASPGWAMGGIGRWYDNFRYGKNTAEMAKTLTDPKSVDLMRRLAKERPDSAKATLIVGEIIAGSQPSTISPPSNTSR